jgi:hypothetical protein
MEALKSANLAVRFLQQRYALAPLAYWGARTRSRLLTKVALGVGALQPLPWGVVVDDQHGPGHQLMVARAEGAPHRGRPWFRPPSDRGKRSATAVRPRTPPRRSQPISERAGQRIGHRPKVSPPR